MRKYEQLKDKDGNLVDPKNLNYEKQLEDHNDRIETLEQNEDVYSFREVKTNKVYIDENGKKWPIYRKILRVNITYTYNENNRMYCWISHNIDNLNKLMPLTGTIFANNSQYPINTDTICSTLISANNKIQIGFTLSQPYPTNHMAEFYLKYTKTTDQING